jgi:HSP20 family molecular chaperone IbpA
MVYGVFDLPVDVDPGRVTAKVEGNSIEISLKKAGQEKVLVQELKVAA